MDKIEQKYQIFIPVQDILKMLGIDWFNNTDTHTKHIL